MAANTPNTPAPEDDFFDNAAEIFGAVQPRKRQPISVPEWGNKRLVLQEMTGAERDNFERVMNPGPGKKANKSSFRASLIRECVINSAGEKIFARSDVAKIAAMPSSGVSRVFDACVTLNGMKPEDIDDLAEDFD